MNSWNDDKPKIIATPKPFGEVMREFNEEVEKDIKQITGIDKINDPYVFLGMDQGAHDDSAFLMQDGKRIELGWTIDLNIPDGWKDKIVKAICILDLAVITSDDEEHCIAHVPTQTWFDNAIPDGSYTIEQYCLWAWKVQQINKDMWEHLKLFNNSTYKTISKDFLEQLKCFCLSVAVS